MLPPTAKFTQDIKLNFDREHLYNDPNLKKINEERKRLEHEEFVRENPFINEKKSLETN